MKELKKDTLTRSGISAGRVSALGKRAGRLAAQNRKQGYH